MAGLAIAPMASRASKTCIKAAAIFPVAFLYHLTALASLPVQVSLATARTIAGVKGRGVDELFASFFTPRGTPGSVEDVQLIEGLRERHGAAMAAVKEQLDDSETRYKVSHSAHTLDHPRRFDGRFPRRVSFSKRDAPTSRLTKRVPSPSPQAVYEKLRESERMRLKMQNRLAHAQEDLRAARGEPPSPHSPGSSFRSGKDADADYDHDKYPMYATTVLMCIALWYFYDLPDANVFDRKMAMIYAPVTWLLIIPAKHPALNKLLILFNLVFFGYLLHILVQWRRESAAISATAPSAAMTFAG